MLLCHSILLTTNGYSVRILATKRGSVGKYQFARLSCSKRRIHWNGNAVPCHAGGIRSCSLMPVNGNYRATTNGYGAVRDAKDIAVCHREFSLYLQVRAVRLLSAAANNDRHLLYASTGGLITSHAIYAAGIPAVYAAGPAGAGVSAVAEEPVITGRRVVDVDRQACCRITGIVGTGIVIAHDRKWSEYAPGCRITGRRCAKIVVIAHTRRVDAPGCRIARIDCTSVVVVAGDRCVYAPGCRITSIVCAGIIVVARHWVVNAPCCGITLVYGTGIVVIAADRRVDATGRRIARIGRAGIVVVAADRCVDTAGRRVARVAGAGIIVIADDR
jgi:hypothetical protein